MKTHAEAKKSTPSRTLAAPVPNALAHQAQLRSALLRAGVQPHLEIGSSVNDPLEREADAAAERVMRMPESSLPSPTRGRGAGGEGTLIQTKASATTTQASPQLESSLGSLNSGGTALDAPTRAFFEPRFGQDFSQVRLHTDAKSAQMAESLSAKAFTLGNNIAFGANQYSGNTPAGRNLLGHELAHVVQQRGLGGGAVQGEMVQRQGAKRKLADALKNLEKDKSSSIIAEPVDKTGFGKKVDEMINKSPTLQKDWQLLIKRGWNIGYGKTESEAQGEVIGKKIVINRIYFIQEDKKDIRTGIKDFFYKKEKGQLKETKYPHILVRTLAHEVGHALYHYEKDCSSRDAYVDVNLADEGYADWYATKVLFEIANDGEPGIFGERDINGKLLNDNTRKYVELRGKFDEGEINEEKVGVEIMEYAKIKPSGTGTYGKDFEEEFDSQCLSFLERIFR